MILIEQDKSIYYFNNKIEKILFFSYEKFLNDICKGTNCFICGAATKEKKFNKEHILPDWLLGRFKLSSKKINLPGFGTPIYGGYTIKCCEECNKKMGATIEAWMANLLKNYGKVHNYVKKNGAKDIYLWLALIFVKIHLKDKEYKKIKGRGANTIISETYNWSDMHHIHCLARSFYTKSNIAKDVFGSLLILPAKVNKKYHDSFDCCTSLPGSAIMLRINDICIIAIFNDSGYVSSIYRNELEKITCSLSPIQIREIFARLVHINLVLKKRPEYYTKLEKGKLNIVAKVPNKNSFKKNYKIKVGELISYYCEDLVKGEKRGEIINNLKRGVFTFLFDENGNFINQYSSNKRKILNL